ncbi:MAG TPA: hypothetical protein VL856_20640 [Acidimicrobiia bacterium]|jgi:hypothetical protein|nr:hypothetical protein [Acidimicrobiia bacterium]
MRRCLIVANQTITGSQLLAEVLARSASEEYEFHLLVPASHAHGSAMWSEGQAIAHARVALADGVEHFRSEGIEVTGEIGDENPVLAVDDALRREHFDEIIVSTLPPGVSRWLKRDLPHRLERRFGLAMTHVIATPAHAQT